MQKAYETDKIVMIDPKHIHPHPNNPRKDLGDLTELRASVKKNGIMQNLTVIPMDEPGEYMALIGHRRSESARLEELEAVPCIIKEGLSELEQLNIMMEENMQRNDLTICEQAQGFQMMLDLGENADSIAEKTGFSKATVYHRLNLAKLDQGLLKKTQENESFQLSLKDLYELEKISDVEKRNEVLRFAKNSSDLAWRVRQKIDEEKKEKIAKEIIAALEKAGVEDATERLRKERWNGNWKCVKTIYFTDNDLSNVSFDGETTKYYLKEYSYIAVYEEVKNKVQEEKTPEQIEREQREENRSKLKEIENEMTERRETFVRNIISGELKADINQDTKDEIWKYLIREDGEVGNYELIDFLSNKQIYQLSDEEEEEYKAKLQQFEAWKTMLMALCVSMKAIGTCVAYDCTYIGDDAKQYEKGNEILAKYGWYLKEEEQQLLDGTHELYEKKEENKNE